MGSLLAMVRGITVGYWSVLGCGMVEAMGSWWAMGYRVWWALLSRKGLCWLDRYVASESAAARVDRRTCCLQKYSKGSTDKPSGFERAATRVDRRTCGLQELPPEARVGYDGHVASERAAARVASAIVPRREQGSIQGAREQ